MEPSKAIAEVRSLADTVDGDRRLGAILVADGHIQPEDIERILGLQGARGIRFGEAAVRLGLISVDDLRRAMAMQYDLPHLLPGNARLNRELVVAFEPFHRCAEQIRALRTQLLMCWRTDRAHQSQMLAIVSPGRGEGRSYIAANLAVAFAQLGRRTLLIDADLRRPRQSMIFSVPDRIGLSAVISERADKNTVAAIPNFGPLFLLPAGARPPNPVELLSREAFPSLIRVLQTEFDVILFDTPAAQTCADAQTIAYRAGSALMIARKHHTRLADTRRVVGELSDAGAEIIGTAFNAF